MTKQISELRVIHGHNNSDKNDSSCDSTRLQSLIDNSNPGDIIKLEGVFDFGIDQFVSIKKDLSFIGTRSPSGDYQTIIKGGENSLSFGWDPSHGLIKFNKKYDLVSNKNIQRWPGRFEIKDILFDRASWSAIMVAASTGVEICNNKFIGGRQIDSGLNAYGFEPPDGSMSPVMITSGQDARQPIKGSIKDISGAILIEGNQFIGGVGYDPNGFDPVHGASSIIHGKDRKMNGAMSPIFIAETESSITIQNNQFNEVTWGLFIMNNSGSQIIRKNQICLNSKDDQGDPIGFSWGGIAVQNYYRTNNHAEVVIEDNNLIIQVTDFFTGILLSSSAGLIKGNIIELDQPPESNWNIFGDAAVIRLYSHSESNIIEGNKITGRCQSGIVLQEAINESGTCSNNIVRDNDLRDFVPTDIKDIWSRLEGKNDIPVLSGSHYHLTSRAIENEIILDRAEKDLILIDDTSSNNPYDVETYKGNNKINIS